MDEEECLARVTVIVPEKKSKCSWVALEWSFGISHGNTGFGENNCKSGAGLGIIPRDPLQWPGGDDAGLVPQAPNPEPALL